MIIAVDFDNTITKPSPFPKTGKIKKNAIRVLNKLKKKHTLVLWTSRQGKYLDEAIKALSGLVQFDYINELPGSGRKIAADIYIDDRILGCKINWNKIEKQIEEIEKNEDIPCRKHRRKHYK